MTTTTRRDEGSTDEPTSDEHEVESGLEEATSSKPLPTNPANLRPVTPSGVKKRYRDRLCTAAELEDLPRPEWLLRGLLPDESLAVLFGKPASGKSLLALEISGCLAAGESFFGIDTRQCEVLYLLGEGQSGFGSRIKAWRRARKLDALPNWTAFSGGVDLTRGEITAEMRAVVAEHEPGLIVVDTLARYTTGDENNSATMNAFVDALTELQEESGATILVVHHSDKKGITVRGHSILEAAADTVLRCTKQASKKTVTLNVDKQKDGAEGRKLEFKVAPLLDSVVLKNMKPVGKKTGASTAADDPDVLPRPVGAERSLAILARIAGEGSGETKDWRVACQQDGISQSSFDKHTLKLRKDEYVVGPPDAKRRLHYQVTDKGHQRLSELDLA